MTVIGPHDALRKKIVAEEGSHHEVLAKQLFEQGLGKRVPCNGIGDGCEDPVEFANGRSTLRDFSGDVMGVP